MSLYAGRTHETGPTPEPQGRRAGDPYGAGAQAESGVLDDRSPVRADLKKRLWVSLALTPPIFLLSGGLWSLFGLAMPAAFEGNHLVSFMLSSIALFYGGWPFLAASIFELRNRRPGLMSLVVSILGGVYVYSSAVNFGMPGIEFYWELVLLVDIMLLDQRLGTE